MNTLEMIPLAKLRLSEANVRKNDSNLFIEELAANIEAKGLLQNLIVVPAKKRGMFDVTAGGRRLRALNYLLEAGKLPKNHPVACRVLDIDAAEQSELSLIENVIRLDMTPTDDDRSELMRLIALLDQHWRHLHGMKTHPNQSKPGRKARLHPDQLVEIRTRLSQPGATVTSVARDLNIGRTTLFDFLRRYPESD